MTKSIFCGANRKADLDYLQRIWRRATEADGEPQVVMLLAESGMGKTRLVQEFFAHLSTTLDGTGEAGYWPDVLEQVGDNLRVNPAEQDCRADRLPPFLWWGLRFTDAGGRNVVNAAMDADLPALAAHLSVLMAGVQDRDRLRSALQTLGDAGLDVALDTLGGGLVKTAAATLRKLWGIGQEFLENRPPASLDAARQREQANKSERVIAGLGAALAACGNRLPICVFADDGHFAGADLESMDLLKRLLDVARTKRWPLLLIVTHWEREWHADESPFATWLKPQGERITRLHLGRVDDLTPMLTQRFPGLTADQRRAILDRVDGNPLFLDELMAWLALPSRAKLFVDMDHGRPLNERGLKETLRISRRRHELAEERLAEAGPAVRQALGIGSLQGMRFLEDLTAEVCAAMGSCAEADVRRAIASSERPHAIIRRDGWAAEFLQRLYFEVAAEELSGHPDEAKVRAALAAGLRRRVRDAEALAALDAEARLATLGLAWAELRAQPSAEDADAAAAAAVMLIAERLARWEILAAGALAQDLVAAMRLRTEPGMRLDFGALWTVFDALTGIGEWDDARWTAERLRDTAASKADESPVSLRNRAIAASLLADCLRSDAESEADLALAASLYAEALEIARALRERLGTPQAERDVSVSLNNVAGIARARGDLAAAQAAYAEALAIRRALRERLGTPEAERDYLVSLLCVGDLAMARKRVEEAAGHYAEMLEIARVLATLLGTPETQRHLARCHERLAQVARHRGDLDAARAELTQARVAAEAFGGQQPASDAAQIVAHVNAALAALE